TNKPIVLRGDGAQVSDIRGGTNNACGNAAVPSNAPLIQFEFASTSPQLYGVEDLQLSRDTAGTLYSHGQPPDSERLTYAYFRNLYLNGPTNASSANPYALLEIKGGLYVTIQNVVVDGGEEGIRMIDSSHTHMFDVVVPAFDDHSSNGIYFQGGGDQILDSI